jgi:hypothetical protein
MHILFIYFMYLYVRTLRYTELQFCLLFCMGVKLASSERLCEEKSVTSSVQFQTCYECERISAEENELD